ncbi:unnamed protein product [Euphydryas editha]|nr:unnamed protein product [Euphydryas editha]
MMHQFKAVENIKSQLTPVEGLHHIDFSENYHCKYGQEIQSAHFGGSKTQLSLHTSVYYFTQLDPPNNYVEHTSFCTVSENVRHDPVLICVHLQALVNRIKELSPNLNKLHILSDGPSIQYRNKSMFYLIASYLGKEFGVDSITWHYTERGHGKGAPDGVGGCVKRICDNHVARGNDVASLDELILCLTNCCKGIEVYRINETLVPEIEHILRNSATQSFKGTLGVHQLSWSVDEPTIIHARRLSCLICAPSEICRHYEMGRIQVKQMRDLILPSTSRVINTSHPSLHSISSKCSERSASSLDISRPNSSISPTTSNAPTEPNSPGFSDIFTPDNSTKIFKQNVRPRKKRLFSNESEASYDSPKKKPPKNFIWDDSDSDKKF